MLEENIDKTNFVHMSIISMNRRHKQEMVTMIFFEL